MKAAKVELKDAEKMKGLLLEEGMLDCNFLPTTDNEFIYFPILSEENPDYVELVEKELISKQKKQSIDDLLSEFLSPDEMLLIPRSQEII